MYCILELLFVFLSIFLKNSTEHENQFCYTTVLFLFTTGVDGHSILPFLNYF